MINYYVEYWASENKNRNEEVVNCINANIKSGFFDNIFIFSSSIEENIYADIIISDRITYQMIFDKSIEGINVFANSDIQFDESITMALNIKNDEFYALTRYENDGNLHKHDDPYKGCDSQDTWIWKDQSKINNANFYIGLPGCDNRIAYVADACGYIVKNPALTIKTKHRHTTNIRSGTSSNLQHRLPPPYRLVPIHELD